MRERARQRLGSVAAACALAVTASACVEDDGDLGMPPRSPAGWAGHADAYGFIPRKHGALRVLVTAPATVPYVAAAFGAGRPLVTLRIKNMGGRPEPLPRVALLFDAVRDGVAFPCTGDGEIDRREPRILAAGSTVRLDRELRCSMPIPGRYEIRSRMLFEDEPEESGVFSVAVAAVGPSVPVEYPGRPGLYAGFASPTPLPSAPDGSFVQIALTNASSTPASLGNVRVTLEVWRNGELVDCPAVARDVWVEAPTWLGPGRTHVARVPVRCDLSHEAVYEIAARATLVDDPDHGEVALGPGRVEVTSRWETLPTSYSWTPLP